MSSHHFIREEQATCLCIFGDQIDEFVLHQLLGWNPIIIANERTLDWLQSLQIRIDILLSDRVRNEINLPYDISIWKEQELDQLQANLMKQFASNRISFVGVSNEEFEGIADWLIEHYNGIGNYAIYEQNEKHLFLQKGKIYKKLIDDSYKASLNENSVKISGCTTKCSLSC